MTTTLTHALARPWIPAELGKLPYFWLLSLGYMLWKYAYVTPSALEVALLALTVLVFFPLYCASYRAHGWQIHACIAGSCVLGALWAPWNPGAACFFIFACAMCGHIPAPRRAVGAMLGVLASGVAAAFIAGPMRMVLLMPVLLVGLPVGLSALMDVRLRNSRAQLLRKQEEVEHMARIAERERISRDLHDLLGHSLSTIALKAELAGKLARRDLAACEREIADIETSARTALAEVRAAVTGFRQSGLVQALASARASLAAAGVALDERIEPIALAPAAEHVLALAVREAVTNILRHAGATRCSLVLVREGDGAILRVGDNGRLRSTDVLQHGNGLEGMRERVAALGGRLSLQAAAGLTLELRVPAAAPSGMAFGAAA